MYTGFSTNQDNISMNELKLNRESLDSAFAQIVDRQTAVGPETTDTSKAYMTRNGSSKMSM